MNSQLARCLDDLEARIVPEEEAHLQAEWAAFSEGRFAGELFEPRRREPSPPGTAWPRITVNEALDDFDAMALQQYAGCSAQLASAGGLALNVRANYGSSILPLLFGVEPFVMAPELDTLPTSRPLNDIEAIKRILAGGVPDLRTGYGARVLEMGERFAALARRYPKIGEYVTIYHPDLQGPMDVVEVVWGSSVFYALYDDPELVKELLALVVETYTSFLQAWARIVPFRGEGHTHWGFYYRGRIMLRDDSAMNLSPGQFDEFIRPYDQALLERFGGGAIHFCGRGSHYIASLSEMRGVTAVNLSQPEYNDMERIFAHTVDRGINLLGLRRSTAQEAVRSGRNLHGRAHCM